MTTSWSMDWREVGAPTDGNTLPITRAYKNATAPPIALETIEREYCRLMHLDYPIRDMVFVRSWMLFRVRLLASPLSATNPSST